MEQLGRLPNGATLYREPNEVGGHRYWSDEIGGGVVVWDTSLVDAGSLLAVLTQEVRREMDEKKGLRKPDATIQPLKTDNGIRDEEI